MKHLLSSLTFSLLLGGALGPAAAAKPAPAPVAAAPVAVPTVAGLGSFNDGYRFGMNRADLTRTVVGNGGLIDKDYDPQLRHAAAGVQQRALEAERDAVKRAFERDAIEFNNVPSGLDSGPLGNEYTYGNREALMILQTQGKKRYYFFIADKLWKVYDEVTLGGPAALGATFNEIDAKLATKFVSQPRRSSESGYPQLEWQDQTTHLRVVDRSSERIVGIVIEDKATRAMLPQLRTHTLADPFAIDPSITAVTQGGLSDPNRQQAQQAEEKEKAKKKGKK